MLEAWRSGKKELNMKNMKISLLTLFFVCTAGIPAFAGDFDGSKPLLCSVISVMECVPNEGCRGTTVEDVNLPQFLKIDLEKKGVTPAKPIEGRQPTKIRHVERVGGKLILQGADEGIEKVRGGLGWTAAISEDTGKLVLTASGDDVAFVVFGACIPY